MDFTYDFPDERAFIDTLIQYLQSTRVKEDAYIASLLDGAECNFSSTGQYSRKRWNAYGAIVYFYVPFSSLRLLQEDDKIRESLIKYCDMLMPKNAGYDIVWVEFSPQLRRTSKKDLSENEDVRRYMAQMGHDITPEEEVRNIKETVDMRKKKVFVIHGRNEKIRKAMFDFLRSIGLSPIEWTQAVAMTGQGSPYIGDILDKAFVEAQAIIALHTPDDEGRLREEFQHENDEDHEKYLTPQARLNVIFETGMALGKNPDRTIIVQVGNIRPYSDIAGRHVVKLDNTVRQRQAVALRLQSAGCDIDLTGTDWHDTGDFSL